MLVDAAGWEWILFINIPVGIVGFWLAWRLVSTAVGFVFASMGFPLMLWAQLVRGDSPTQAGLLLAPMAVMSIVLAPITGKLTDRVHPSILAGAGLTVLATSLVLLASAIGPDTPLWQVLGSMGLLGVGSSFVWAPLTTTANRNLPMHQAGAGAGIYNANRQIGSVMGAAAIAVLIDSATRGQRPR